MALEEFFGCLFISFSVPCALLIFTILDDPLKIIIFLTSSFFWILSLLLSGLLWLPFQLTDPTTVASKIVGIIIAVCLQEVSRIVFHIVTEKACAGLSTITASGSSLGSSLAISDYRVRAYVCSFGFGIISGIFNSTNFLHATIGPWSAGLNGDSAYFFIASAVLTACIILLNIFWGMLVAVGMRLRKWPLVLLVIVMHLGFSLMTLLNEQQQLYGLVCTLSCALVFINAVAVFRLLNGRAAAIPSAFCLALKGGAAADDQLVN